MNHAGATPVPKPPRSPQSSESRRSLDPLDLLGRPASELRAWMVAAGEPAYRGTQLYHAIYAERRFDFDAMTNLPAALRARLAAETRIGIPQITRRYCSADGSVRYLLSPGSSREALGGGVTGDAALASDTMLARDPRLATEAMLASAGTIPSAKRAIGVLASTVLADDVLASRITPGEPMNAARAARVEAVFMPSQGRQTICISTQAGCAVDCHFCLTAQLGLIRNLSAGEIAGQVLVLLEDHRETLAPRTNVVLMGQGEPLLNYDRVLAAVRLMLDPAGMGLAARHVTLSTSGIVPGIMRLAQEEVRPRLAVSLNASTDAQRDAIMPINRKYPLRDLLAACRQYPLRPWERLTFEYVLLGGFNDAADDARRVARLADGLRAKVNLIPWNPGELPYRAPEPERVEEFQRVLADKGIPAFVRYSRGRDIFAACGQLALLDTPG
jgi:23S rRNA (adenine2503-C2)-methyltransferase